MLPRIDFVIIGLNSAKTLAACIGSVKGSHYPQDLIEVIYADGGSSDGSQDLARSLGAKVIEYEADLPAPGGQRNVGWQAGSAPFVQFLDSDTQMDPDWPAAAVAAMDDGVGAVNGDRRELYPEASVFNWLGDLEWNGPAGDAEAFGGDVLVRRAALEATGGYDPQLIGGEDPELSHRIRLAGYRLVKLDHLMTKHDLAMKTLKQYWRRAYRSGHAYAEVNARHREFWARPLFRILLRGWGFVAIPVGLVLAIWSPWTLVASALGAVLVFQPRLLSTRGITRHFGLTPAQGRTYAWHASVVVVPQFFGALRFYWGRATRNPHTNRKLRKKA